jgi:hypothetical protein
MHQLLVRTLLLICLLPACGNDELPTASAQMQRALIPATPTQDLDMLFVMDDSPSTLDMQTELKTAFPMLIAELAQVPNLHLGVVTSDLGSKGFDDPAPGPSIGSGPGSCSGYGKAARLQTGGSMVVQGSFISDVAGADGTRTKNYTTSLADAFSAIASVGSGGCGFEQPLEAMRLALLDPSGDNAGFLRPNARLAVIALQDEDDCSFAHSTLLGVDTASLGPLQSFRCTRFGVTCDDGGLTSDAMESVGEKQNCHSNEGSPYLGAVARYRDVLTTIKPDPRDVLFAAIAGPGQPLEIELRTPPGGGTAIPALAHSCSWQTGNGSAVADPAVRMADLASSLPRGDFESVCQDDYAPTARAIARQIRNLLGDTCVPVALADQTGCTAVDQHADGTEIALPPCPGATSTTRDCFELVADSACSASGVRVVTHRVSAPSADTMVSLRCTNP